MRVTNKLMSEAASLNIMNGFVGLTFSCDGSHYLDYRDFLDSEQFQAA